MGKVNTEGEITFERIREVLNKDNSPLAKAFLEDESVRLASQRRSAEYLDIVEKEKNAMPGWMWPVLYFLLGYLSCLSEPAAFFIVWDLFFK